MINPDVQPNNFSDQEIIANSPAEDSAVLEERVIYPQFGTATGEANSEDAVVSQENQIEEELILDFDKLRGLTGEERNAALYALAGKMAKQVSEKGDAKDEEKAKNAYKIVLEENLASAVAIEGDMDGKTQAVLKNYGTFDDAPTSVQHGTNKHSSTWGWVGVAALGAMGAMAPSDVEARDDRHRDGNVFQQFGRQMEQGINRGVREAGRDSGGVLGGVARVIIDREVNRAAVGILRGAGVPVEQAPEEIVVVPRSIPSAGTNPSGVPGRVYGRETQIGNVYGVDRQAASEQVRAQAQYARERNAIEAKWSQAKVDAFSARQDAEMVNLNAQYSVQLQRANETQKGVIYANWAAAKSELKARHQEQGPEAEINKMNRNYEQKGVNIQISAQEREALRRINESYPR